LGSPERVLDYLGRYTHRVAISNHRLISVGDNQVTFSYRDRHGGHRPRAMTLGAEEFIRRFLLHVLPDGLRRIRHFGLLANRAKKQDLARCRELLGAASPPAPLRQSPRELLLAVSGIDFTRCPACRRGRMVDVGGLPCDPITTARLGAAQAPALDSS
jgi:Putative transposase